MSNYKNEIRENVIRTYKALVDENYNPKVVEPVITVDNMAAIADAAEQGGGGGTSVQELDGEYKLNVSALLEMLGDNKGLSFPNARILLGTTYDDSQSETAGVTDYIEFVPGSLPDPATVVVHFNGVAKVIETNVTGVSATIEAVLAGIDQSTNSLELIGNIVPLFSFRTTEGTFEPEYSSYNVEDLFTLVETPVVPGPVPVRP